MTESELAIPYKKNPKVLFIDDNFEFFQSISPVLDKHLQLDYAPDGFVALKMLINRNFDVVVCDINMPMINGFSLLREAHKKDINVPFLFISGNMNEQIISDAIRLGAFNVLEKPCNIRDILNKIDNAMDFRLYEKTFEVNIPSKIHIYNSLKKHYSQDFDIILRKINQSNLDTKSICEELEKKDRTGQCIFDDYSFTVKKY